MSGERLSKKKLIIDNENILRLSGRLEKFDFIDIQTRRPACLDGNHPYARAMIQQYHEKFGPQGADTVVNEHRKKFWIPEIRCFVKRITNDCIICKKQRCEPIVPIMGNLPKERLLIYEEPFTACGIDYFGPFQVKIGRRLDKRYGVLITCLTSRAIHVEIAHSLTADSCIMAIRRLLARRAQVLQMWFDNGTNLKETNRELIEALEAIDTQKLLNETANVGIEWTFISSGSPHMGGCWERLTGCFKPLIQVIRKEKHPTEEVLQALFAEADYIVNSRPLTYPSTDGGDLCSISANVILISKSVNIGSPRFSTKNDEVHKKQWHISQFLADRFWKRWLREYIPTLLSRKKWRKETENLKEGELVLIGDKNIPRAT